MMNDLNISKSIVSITSPGTYLVSNYDELAVQVAQDCNDFAAKLKKDDPDRFGFWASLPLPDVNGSLVELARALDELDADGIALETNSHGTYLGDPAFDDIFAELNRRKATVFIHPTSPCMHTDIGQVLCAPLLAYPRPIFEFLFDTARVIINLFHTGTIRRYPDITYIIPHAGGTFPPLVDRSCKLPALIGVGDDSVTPEAMRQALRAQFYFDLAGFPFPDQIKGLLPFVSASQLLYGSDYPYTPVFGVKECMIDIESNLPLIFPSEDDQRAIYASNARRLLSKGKSTEKSS